LKAYHRPHPPEITDEAKAWVVSLACSKPKDHGRAAEVWSISALSDFVSSHAVEAGHPRLTQAGKSTVWRILNERQIKPHKISYYLERRDPDSDQKMKEVLMVYHEFTGRVPMPHWRASASWPGWSMPGMSGMYPGARPMSPMPSGWPRWRAPAWCVSHSSCRRISDTCA